MQTPALNHIFARTIRLIKEGPSPRGAERHAAIDQNRLHQTLQQAAEKYLRPSPQGLKPIENQTLNVGAKAPTPLKMGIFSTALNCCSTALAAMDRSEGKKLVPAGFTPHRGQPENAPKG